MPAYAPQPTRNILIIGSTGVIGTYITRAIIDARDDFDRICVLTSEKTFMDKLQDICALEAWGVEIFTGKLEKESSVKKAYEGTFGISVVRIAVSFRPEADIGGSQHPLHVARHISRSGCTEY